MKPYSHFKIIITAFLLLLLPCCQPTEDCKETENIYHSITEDTKSKMPYSGNDTISFLSDAGDTAILIGQGKVRSEEVETISHPICPPTRITRYELITISFTGSNPELALLNIRLKSERNIRVETKTLSQSTGTVYLDYMLANSPEDSIFLQGKYEAGVYLFYNPSRVFLFNYSKGVLKFKETNGKTWTKIR